MSNICNERSVISSIVLCVLKHKGTFNEAIAYLAQIELEDKSIKRALLAPAVSGRGTVH